MHTVIVALFFVALIAGFALVAHLVRFRGEHVDEGL
jgi:hypothetical protein